MHLSKNCTLDMQLKHIITLIGALLKSNSSTCSWNSLTSFELFSLELKACWFFYWSHTVLVGLSDFIFKFPSFAKLKLGNIKMSYLKLSLYLISWSLEALNHGFCMLIVCNAVLCRWLSYSVQVIPNTGLSKVIRWLFKTSRFRRLWAESTQPRNM